MDVWDTYKAWWIIGIIIIIAIILIYIFVCDCDISEIFDFIVDIVSEHLRTFFSFFTPIITALITLIIKGVISWVTILIILGSLVSGLIICGFIMLIISLIEGFVDFITNLFHKNNKDSNAKNNDHNLKLAEISNTLFDEEHLSNFTVSELKEYCRYNKIKGYSSLNKKEIIHLIITWAKEIDESTIHMKN